MRSSNRVKRNNLNAGFRLAWVFAVSALILAGCATVPMQRYPRSYTDMRSIAKQYNLQYEYDMFLETVKLTGLSISVKGLIGSPLVYYNGSIYDLQAPIEYRDGNVFLPESIRGIFVQKKFQAYPLPSIVDIKTVILDAGHGGKDPGARYGGIEEKRLNLKIVGLLKNELEKYGIKVLLTRIDDRYISLKKRVRIAADSQADFFVSIHVNASRNRARQGFEIYYLSERFMNEQVKEVVMKENADVTHEITSTTSHILKDMISQENLTRSLELAHAIYRAAGKFGMKTNCIRGAPFYVLKYNRLPSILVEVGYLSNPYERTQLIKSSFLKEIVESITLGIITLKKQYAYVYR